jgi:hypothetical protein
MTINHPNERNRIMKRSIIAVALAAFAVASFAGDQHRNNARESERHSVAKQQLADSSEWRRSRPGGDQDPTRESSNGQT